MPGPGRGASGCLRRPFPTGKNPGLQMMSNLARQSRHTASTGWLAALAALCLLLTAGSTARAAGLTLSLDRNTITIGENATLTLTFPSGSIRGLPALPRIPNLTFSDAQGHSTRMSIINGDASSTESYMFVVTPAQPGEYTIPSLTMEINGEPQHSEPVKLTVLKGGDTGPNPMVFIRLLVPKQKVYVGEVVKAQFELFLRDGVVNIQNFDLGSIPAQGFTVGKTKEEAHTQTQVNGVAYTVIPITMVFTAVKAGTLSLGPLTCNLDLLFGPVDFFGRPTRSQHFTVTNDVVNVESVPPPREHAPAEFNGAVGSYSMNVSASPTNVSVGDPITITIQIAGRGALDALTLPEQTNWQGFKLYPPTSDYQPGDALALTGMRTFKLTAVPETMDVQKLPPYKFAFFDPDTGAYRTLEQPAVPLVVRPSAASLPPPVLPGATTASDNPATNADILHIKPFLGVVGQIEPPLVVRPWFLALQSAPLAAWLGLLVRRKYGEKLAANPRLRRQREVERTIRDGLKELRHAADANEAEKFFATLFHLLQERLGERLDLPASAITEAVLVERLEPLGVPEETLTTLRELFQTCNQARYAPASTNEELRSLIPKVESALAELKHLKA